LGEIRLEWWRSALGEVAAGGAARDHPALAALRSTLANPASAARLQAVAVARRRDLDPAPFESFADLDRYLDVAVGEPMRLAFEVCDATAGAAIVTPAAQAWGYAGLLRAAPFWTARGRTVLPREGGREDMLRRAEAAYIAARWTAPNLPRSAFPAIGYLALLPGYLRALRAERPMPALLARQLKLIVAAAAGRI
jgi:phytoene synthase